MSLAVLRTAAALLPSSLPNLHAQEDPPCRATHIQADWQEVPTSTNLIQKGPREEALPAYKITPLASNYTARVSPQTFERSQKKTSKRHCTPHAQQSKAIRKESSLSWEAPSQTLPPPNAAQDIPPDLPGLSTYLQFPLASHCSGCHCCRLRRSAPQRLP